MAAKGQKYVTQGAILKCTLGSVPSILKVTSDLTVLSEGKLVATDKDKKGFVNILPFGVCYRSSPPPPCTPSPTTWTKTHANHFSCKKKDLLEKSTIGCNFGGTISISFTAQQQSVTEARVQQQNGPKIRDLELPKHEKSGYATALIDARLKKDMDSGKIDNAYKKYKDKGGELTCEEYLKNYRDRVAKDIIGEVLSERCLEERFPDKTLTKLNGGPTELYDEPKGHGIDGLWKVHPPPPKYIITDAKYGGSKPGNTKFGKQLSENWIKHNLIELYNKQVPIDDPGWKSTYELFQDISIEHDNYVVLNEKSNFQSLLIQVDENGNCEFIEVDKDGNPKK